MSKPSILSSVSSEGGQHVSECGDWLLHEYPEVTSTNLLAAGLPAWHAVRADTQTKGRGRFQRSWVSDKGGLWLSAVVPMAPEVLVRRALPLAGGVAVCNTLHELGISGFRLRWPNDVLIEERKIAGLLIDQFSPRLAVVGIGINVRNRPETADPTLANRTIRLADLLPTPPDLPLLTRLLLRNIRHELECLDTMGPAELFARVNRFWVRKGPVQLDLDGRTCRGTFNGVDHLGRLALASDAGEFQFYDAHQVRHLTEG
jgi:BirA family transcriptional regulator, biotin operon repressor / biotin---[acetyl-CoA-carboxylase] ligase